MVLKVVIGVAIIVALVYLVYRATDWYFTEKEREGRLDALRRVQRMAEQEAVWEDGDPDTFDRDRYEQELAQAGFDKDVREDYLKRLEEGREIDVIIEDP